MENKLLRFWASQDFPHNTTVFCAVSGGADSMAMLHLLWRLQEKLCISVKCAHFNHHLRGAESTRDEHFVREFCKAHEIPLHTGSAEILTISKQTGESIEECARRERYAFFASLGGFVATAHTQEDNFETALLNLIRGTALKGLCGIPAKRDYLIRPMLCFRHEQLRAYLKAHEILHVEDSTNQSRDCLRNRLRLDILPLLERENPSLIRAFSETSTLLQKDEDFLSQLADKALVEAARPGGYACSVLASLPEPIRRRAIRSILNKSRVKKLSRKHIQACESLLISLDPSACVTLPEGLILRREYDLLLAEPAAAAQALDPVALPLGKEIDVPQLDCIVFAELKTLSENMLCSDGAFAVKADADTLVLRSRKTHDRIRLAEGSKSLKKLMIDRKIPLRKRAMVPILADKDGVLAVLGIGVNQERKAGVGEPAVIITIKKRSRQP